MKNTRRFFIVFFLNYLLLTTYDLRSSELLYTPSYGIGEALALPSTQELATELLWDVWKRQPQTRRGKTGIVFSGGGGRGFAHVGVLRHLEEIGFPIEGVVGTSMGAVIGGLYASGVSVEQIETMAGDAGFNKFGRFTTRRFLQIALRDGLAPSTTFEQWLGRVLGKKTFDDLKIPFLATATDLSSGELVILRSGELVSALRASATIPGFFAPAQIRQYYLVDGGLILNIPGELARQMGLENVLVVDTSQHHAQAPLSRAPSALRALYRAIEIQGDYLRESRSSEGKGDFILRAYHPDIHTFELWRWKEAQELGIREARSQSYLLRLAFIKKTIKKLGRKFFSIP